MYINQLQLNVSDIGSGMPFIWSHGLMGSMEHDDKLPFLDWDCLSGLTRLIRYDARGHGKSGFSVNPEDYIWSRLADDMIAIADYHGVESFVAAGHSMGCATALYTALKVPDRVEAVILSNPPTAWDTRGAHCAMYERMAEMVETKGVEYLVKLLRAYPTLPAWQLATHPQLNDYFLEALSSFEGKQLATILRGAKLSDLPSYEALKTISVPTLILAWIDDTTHPLETADVMSELMSNSQLVIATNMEQVGNWTKLIMEYLTG